MAEEILTKVVYDTLTKTQVIVPLTEDELLEREAAAQAHEENKKRMDINGLVGELKLIDQKKTRAISEFILTSDKERLEKLEAEAVAIRLKIEELKA